MNKIPELQFLRDDFDGYQFIEKELWKEGIQFALVAIPVSMGILSIAAWLFWELFWNLSSGGMIQASILTAIVFGLAAPFLYLMFDLILFAISELKKPSEESVRHYLSSQYPRKKSVKEYLAEARGRYSEIDDFMSAIETEGRDMTRYEFNCISSYYEKSRGPITIRMDKHVSNQ